MCSEGGGSGYGATCRDGQCTCGDGYTDPQTGEWVPGDVARAQRALKEKEKQAEEEKKQKAADEAERKSA